MLLENHDVVAVIEIWWDDFYDWTVAVGNYKPFRGTDEEEGEEVPLYQGTEGEELSMKNGQEQGAL